MALDLFKLFGTIEIDNKSANKSLDETSGKGSQAESKLSKAFNAFGKGAKVAGKAIAAGLAVGATAIAGLVSKSAQEFAAYEQLIGGVETLFKNSAAKVEQYANDAFRTAGLSANNYMETVTSFSASLLQSLDNDTEEAAEYAQLAITDMADNANKMGTNIASIQVAYQGFAKQNYSMLDNLKLGYGGTAAEMYRLMERAAELDESFARTAEFSLDTKGHLEADFADIVKAIHIVQTEMGITGTTAKEAATTISGSITMTKSAWSNLMSGLAQDNANLPQLINNVTSSGVLVLQNLIPVAQQILASIPAAITEMMGVIMVELPSLVQSLLPGVIEGAVALLSGLAQILPELFVVVVAQIPILIQAIRLELERLFPELEEPFSVIEKMFSDVWNAAQTVWHSVGAPIFEAVGTAFSAARDALQPLADAFNDYVLEGGFAEDTTTAISAAVDVLTVAYEAVSGIVIGVVDGFKAAVEWGKQHETAVTLIAIAIGTLTAAIGAYNVAMAIKNAGGIVELAQLAATAIGVGALTVAETAHTVATTVATAATTALSTAMAFLTSPITLVVAAIGALIAIVVLCVKHWDDIKLAAANAWEWIQGAWSNAATWFDTNVIQPIVAFFTGLWDSLVNIWDGICNAVSIALQLIGSIIEAAFLIITLPFQFIWENCKELVFSAFEWIKEAVETASQWVSDKMAQAWAVVRDNIITPIKEAYERAKESFENLKSAISEKVNAAKDKATEAFTNLKNKAAEIFTAIREKVTESVTKLKDKATETFNNLRSKASEIFTAIKEKITTPINAAKDKVQSTIQSLRDSATEKFNSIKSKASEIFAAIKEKMTQPIENAKDKIKGIVDTVKGFFSNMTLSFPKIKLPHFSISPSGWKIGDLLEGSIPRLDIDWYARAMNNPIIMDKPTIFGYNGATGELMGGGEAGTEVVSGAGTLMRMIQTAVASQNDALVALVQTLIDMLADYFPDALDAMRSPAVFDANIAAKALAVPMNRELGRISTLRERGR